MMEETDALQAAVDAARGAGKILMDNYGKINVKHKVDGTIVTNADLESEKYIISQLKKEFPEYSILAEESGREQKESEYIWVIDPLDGTTNYSIQNPFFNVSIALAHKSEPVVGAVYSPFQDEMFSAEKGKGAYMNGEEIKVSSKNTLEESVHTFCHASNEAATKKMADIWTELKLLNPKVRQIGAGALELSYVACGRVESFMMIDMNPWDVAAGTLLVREAGGRVTDFSGKEFDIECKDILASNGILHEKLLDIVKQEG